MCVRVAPMLAVLLFAVGCSGGEVTLPSQATTAQANSVTLVAAGSLLKPLSEAAALYTAQTGFVVNQTYRSSGTLRAQIESGAISPDVFASADLGNPQTLQREGKSGPVTVFTHNRLCLLAKTAVVQGRGVADVMLDSSVPLATSTPKADPAGDYAEAIFAKIDAERPGSLALLDAKALRLVGGPTSPPIPTGQDTGLYLLLTSNQADAFLAYCSGNMASAALAPQALVSLEMPADLAVRADYGVTVITGAKKNGQSFASFLLSEPVQAILVKFGFSHL